MKLYSKKTPIILIIVLLVATPLFLYFLFVSFVGGPVMPALLLGVLGFIASLFSFMFSVVAIIKKKTTSYFLYGLLLLLSGFYTFKLLQIYEMSMGISTFKLLINVCASVLLLLIAWFIPVIPIRSEITRKWRFTTLKQIITH